MQLNSVVLPAPFGPIRPEDLALVQRERDAVQRDDAAEPQREVANLEQRAARDRRTRRRGAAPRRISNSATAHAPITPGAPNRACIRAHSL